MCSRHLTPHGSVHRPLLLRVRFVHVAEFLPQVKRRRRFVRNVFQLIRDVFSCWFVRARLCSQNNATDVHSVSLLLFFADKKKTKDVSQSRFYYASLLFMEDDDDDDGTRPKRRRPKEKKREKKQRTRDPPRNGTARPTSRRSLAVSSRARMRLVFASRLRPVFLNARDFASHTRHHRARRKRVQKRS